MLPIETSPLILGLVVGLAALTACSGPAGSSIPMGADHPSSPSAEEGAIRDPGGILARKEAIAAQEEAEHGSQFASASAAVQYVCPMHPDVVADQPGTCPRCGMPLEARSSAAQEAHHDH